MPPRASFSLRSVRWTWPFKVTAFCAFWFTRPKRPPARRAYTRNGKLFMSRQGELVVGQADGYRLMPPISIPANTTQLAISPEGKITATVVAQGAVAGQAGTATLKEVGQLVLVRFADPTGLKPLGGGIYVDSESSGQPVVGSANDAGAGAIVQGHLESSNVDLVRERMRLRFLQGWRSAIIGSLDGQTFKSASVSNPAAAGAADFAAQGNMSVTPPQSTATGR